MAKLESVTTPNRGPIELILQHEAQGMTKCLSRCKFAYGKGLTLLCLICTFLAPLSAGRDQFVEKC
jgi:hypothetical protein